MTVNLQRYLDYIKNAQNPTVDEFIEDWEPIGRALIDRLKEQNLILIKEDRLYLVE